MIKVNKLLARKGFTLIELLVVIAIIGILATIIVASFTSAQQRSRDARRKADLDAVKKALELAKADCTGGYYPVMAGATGVLRYDALESHLDDADLGYIRQVPVDPSRPVAEDYQYTTLDILIPPTAVTPTVCLDTATPPTRSLSGYPVFLLRALLENVNDPSAVESRDRCASSGAPTSGPLAVAGAYYTCD